MIALIVIAVVVVLLGFSTVSAYNGLVRRRNQADNAWSQIDVQLKRRYDLIPNLVGTVYYNDAVLAYNNAIATFPPSVVAGMFSFRSREYFEAAGEERGSVRVQF